MHLTNGIQRQEEIKSFLKICLNVFMFCRDFLHTVYSQVNSIMGHFNTSDLASNSSGPLGAIMFVLYETLLIHIWINLLIVIICDVHDQVRVQVSAILFCILQHLNHYSSQLLSKIMNICISVYIAPSFDWFCQTKDKLGQNIVQNF